MQDVLSLLSDVPELNQSLHRLRNLPDTPEFDPGQWQVVESLFELLPLAVLQLQKMFHTQGKSDFTENCPAGT